MEKQVAHTPGPWIADDNEGFSPWRIYGGMSPTGHGPAGPLIATVVCDSAQADANARLIAVAPHLLEALRLVVQQADQLATNTNNSQFARGYTAAARAISEAARAAIEKATGSPA